MADTFDIMIDSTGEMLTDDGGEIASVTKEDLRFQLAFCRIKSVAHNWFIDNIGANLEELIGRRCNSETAEYGKQKIINELTKDGLYSNSEIHITASIENNFYINYDIYLKAYQGESEDTIVTAKITATLDLVRGVLVRYGWEPRR